MKDIKSIKILVLLLILLQLSFGNAPKIGMAGAPELLIPMGARNVSMGGADISNIAGPEAIYWNPAGLGKVQNVEATFNYMNYFADMNVSYVATGINAGQVGVIGLSFQALDIGSWEETTIWMPEGTGQSIEPTYMTVGVTYARRFTDRILFGANGKVIREDVGKMSASGIAFDLGLQYVTPFGVSFGVTMKNLGSEIKYDGTPIEFDSDIDYSDPNATTRKTKLDMASHELPASMSLGLGYNYDLGQMGQINVASSYNHTYYLDKGRFGAEYVFNNMISLRGGYVMNFYPEDWPREEESQFGLSLGAGLNLDVGGTALMIDYAYRPMSDFDANQYFAISLGL
ncbi:MAG: PorV/PorQ family protein [Candidatus Marinimicrobia bacterium]|nr:PorV/PorQ family protein [Candidatus Neomarinimicrobiota bacterium]